MNFTYENQGTHTYLVHTVEENDAIDTMSLGMLTNNRIPGLAQTIFTQMDATKFIKYDVSAKVSVKQFFAGQVNKKRLIGVFNGIVDAMLSAEDYMIDVNSILLDLDYIFADVSTCETVLVCLPIISDDLSNRDLGAFFKNIMFSTQFDQTENCDHVAKIINYLNSAPVFSLDEFKRLLDTIGAMNVSAQAPQRVVQQPVVQQPVVQQPVVQQPVVQQPVVHQPVTPVQPAPAPVVPQRPAPAPQPQGRPAPAPSPAPAPAQTPQGEKPMSWFYLMQHYTKENAAIYKAQQEAAKVQKGGQKPAAAPAAPAPQRPASKPSANVGFAIPGQSAPVDQGFAVPGQSAPSGQNFAIPGQKPAPAKPAPAPQPAVKPAARPAQPAVVPPRPAPAPVPVYTPAPTPQGHAMNFGETTVLSAGGGIGETTVLGASPATQVRPHLIRSKNNEKIILDKPVFRIGKERSYVDYFIGDNSAISRSHANVISRDGEYFVIDTNSTNHTYVNGSMIQSNVETKIAHGTVIKLANEDFEFRLY